MLVVYDRDALRKGIICWSIILVIIIGLFLYLSYADLSVLDKQFTISTRNWESVRTYQDIFNFVVIPILAGIFVISLVIGIFATAEAFEEPDY